MGSLGTKQSNSKGARFLMLLVLRSTGFHEEGTPNLILTYSHVSSAQLHSKLKTAKDTWDRTSKSPKGVLLPMLTRQVIYQLSCLPQLLLPLHRKTEPFR